jgi:hypothetical protein
MNALSTERASRSRVPSAPVLIGGVYAICVLLMELIFAAQILFTDTDPHAPEGPIESMVSIGWVGTAALLLGVLPGLALARTAGGAKAGAIGYGALSVVILVFFWSGAPGIFGAVAAWLGGLTRGRSPQTNVARGFAIVGLCIAILNAIVSIGGTAASALAG